MDPYEIVLVNDGSPDARSRWRSNIHRRDPRSRVIDLSRNFGHHKALMTGLARAAAISCSSSDSDLEEDPAGLALVSTQPKRPLAATSSTACRRPARAAGSSALPAALYYRVFNQLVDAPDPSQCDHGPTHDPALCRALVRHRDQESAWQGSGRSPGSISRPLVVNKRSGCVVLYSPASTISAFVNAITSFSNRAVDLHLPDRRRR